MPESNYSMKEMQDPWIKEALERQDRSFLFSFQIKVEYCALQLELIAKGDIVGAKSLDSFSRSKSIDPEVGDGTRVSCSTAHSRAKIYNSENWNQGWTSLQFTEAMFVLNKLLKPKTKSARTAR